MNFTSISAFAFLFLLLLLLFVSSPARADRIDDYIRAQMHEKNVPGAAVAVIKNGKTVKAEGYGLASVEFNVPVTKDTVFEIGSVSKQITAAAIMLLIEDGKINLDDKISKYLSNTPEIWGGITVRHLLTHTSGIKNYTNLPSGFELIKRLKRDDFVKELGNHPLEFAPGERWNYSNSGYNLAGYIVETVSGKSYWDFVKERIFQPLGMNQTANRDPRFVIKNRATGYEWENGELIGRDWDLTDVFAAGAIISTITDLVKWDAALRGNRFLQKESRAQMWTPVVLNGGKSYPYSLGWNVTDFRGHKLHSHGGQTAGFAASMHRFVDDELTVIVLTNLGDIGLGGAMARGVAKIYLPDISLRALKEQPGADAKISALLENALRGRIENKLNPSLLTDGLQKALTNWRNQELTRKLNSYGAIKSFVFVGGETAGKNRVYRYLVETPKRLMLWRFAVNEDEKIAEMIVEEDEF